MRPRRRNADDHLRALERRAYETGDQASMDALVSAKVRAGRAESLTLHEIKRASRGIIPPGLVAELLGEITVGPIAGRPGRKDFVVNCWISDPYPVDGDFAAAAKVPAKVIFGVGDNDQILVEARGWGAGRDGMLFAVEYANDRVEGWVWGADVISDEGQETNLVHYRRTAWDLP